MKSLRKVRCACCGVAGTHEGRGLIKACYERARLRGLLNAYPCRPPKIVIKKGRWKGIRDKHLHAVWNALCANPRASMREIEQMADCALATVQEAVRELYRRGLIDREPTHARTIRITGARHQGHAYRVVWFDLS